MLERLAAKPRIAARILECVARPPHVLVGDFGVCVSKTTLQAWPASTSRRQEFIAALASLIREAQFSPRLRQFLDPRRNGVRTIRNFDKEANLATGASFPNSGAIVDL